MITASTQPDFAGLASRLARQARLLAEADAERAALARLGNASRWRRAGLLWPIFTKG